MYSRSSTNSSNWRKKKKKKTQLKNESGGNQNKFNFQHTLMHVFCLIKKRKEKKGQKH
jgi:hypothetical protein